MILAIAIILCLVVALITYHYYFNNVGGLDPFMSDYIATRIDRNHVKGAVRGMLGLIETEYSLEQKRSFVNKENNVF